MLRVGERVNGESARRTVMCMRRTGGDVNATDRRDFLCTGASIIILAALEGSQRIVPYFGTSQDGQWRTKRDRDSREIYAERIQALLRTYTEYPKDVLVSVRVQSSTRGLLISDSGRLG